MRTASQPGDFVLRKTANAIADAIEAEAEKGAAPAEAIVLGTFAPGIPHGVIGNTIYMCSEHTKECISDIIVSACLEVLRNGAGRLCVPAETNHIHVPDRDTDYTALRKYARQNDGSVWCLLLPALATIRHGKLEIDHKDPIYEFCYWIDHTHVRNAVGPYYMYAGGGIADANTFVVLRLNDKEQQGIFFPGIGALSETDIKRFLGSLPPGSVVFSCGEDARAIGPLARRVFSDMFERDLRAFPRTFSRNYCATSGVASARALCAFVDMGEMSMYTAVAMPIMLGDVTHDVIADLRRAVFEFCFTHHLADGPQKSDAAARDVLKMWAFLARMGFAEPAKDFHMLEIIMEE